MIKMQILGHLGKDALMNVHGTDSVLNFSVAQTDKWKDNGVPKERTTWIDCSWWIDSQSPVVQYMKKGVMIWAEGIPGARAWDTRDGKKGCSLTLRILSLQLCGGGRREGDNNISQPSQNAPAQNQNAGGNNPYAGSGNPVDDSDLPF